jgi:hypothetical protein
VIGAGAGILYGLIESANARPSRRGRNDEDDERGFHLGHGVHLSLGPTASAAGPGVAAVLSGRTNM